MIFMNFCSFWNTKLTNITKLKVPKMAKRAVLEIPDCLELISRKIWYSSHCIAVFIWKVSLDLGLCIQGLTITLFLGNITDVKSVKSRCVFATLKFIHHKLPVFVYKEKAKIRRKLMLECFWNCQTCVHIFCFLQFSTSSWGLQK